jgi:hypothetical protein
MHAENATYVCKWDRNPDCKMPTCSAQATLFRGGHQTRKMCILWLFERIVCVDAFPEPMCSTSYATRGLQWTTSWIESFDGFDPIRQILGCFKQASCDPDTKPICKRLYSLELLQYPQKFVLKKSSSNTGVEVIAARIGLFRSVPVSRVR